ncbi:MAG: hypothetical protein AAFW64_06515 [Pseudomonadota bacterium]
MGLGDMLGGLGGADAILSKLSEAGIDASAIEGLDLEAVTSLLADKGFDLSMLEGMGLSVEDIIAKLTGK